MPIPINPHKSDNKTSGYFPMDSSFLSNLVMPELHQLASLKTVLASDSDVNLLMDVWNNSKLLKNAEKVEDKLYEVPSKTNNNDILKLKSAGLISGDQKQIKFTSRAVNVIKTMVLGEQNEFTKKKVSKPYSLILAEQNRPKRKSILALSSNNNICLEKTAMSGNIPIVDQYGNKKDRPSSTQEFVYNKRSRFLDAHSDKEYNIRVYKSKDGHWFEVWAFNGRTGGTMKAQPKGRYHTLDVALRKAREIYNEKAIEGYEQFLTRPQEINPTIPGLDRRLNAGTNDEDSISPPLPTTRTTPPEALATPVPIHPPIINPTISKPRGFKRTEPPKEETPEEKQKRLKKMVLDMLNDMSNEAP